MNRSSTGICLHFNEVPQLRAWLEIKILQSTRSRAHSLSVHEAGQCLFRVGPREEFTQGSQTQVLKSQRPFRSFRVTLIYSVFLYS